MTDQQKTDLDHAELGRLAEAAEADNDNPDYWAAVRSLEAFNTAANPATVLALLSDNAALRAERDEAVGLLREIADAPQPKNASPRFHRALASVNAFVARLNASALKSIARETGK